MSSVTALLIAHHAADLQRPRDLPTLSDSQLGELAPYGIAAWPASRALTVRMLHRPSEDLLEYLRAYGARAAVQVGTETNDVPIELMRAIVNQPAQYPLSWVLEAEHRISQHATEPHLADVAESEAWFSG
jgi:hypothetical protein